MDMVGMEGTVDMADTVEMAEVMEDTVVTEMVDTVDMVATEVTDMDIRKGKPLPYPPYPMNRIKREARIAMQSILES